MILSNQNYDVRNEYILKLSFSQMRDIIKSEAKIEQIIAKNVTKNSRRDFYD